MAKSAGKVSNLDDDDEHDGYDSSSYRGEIGKVDEKSSERKAAGANAHRSKHSETEQRRRSKINERFQILRNLIPQNDQKRDKASFLLEVIEYIQFLQEKLRIYEGSYQGWSQEPTKLIPWKNNYAPTESLMDHPQVKNGSAQEHSALLTDVQNPMEPDPGTAAMYKPPDHPPGSATPAADFNVQAESNMFVAAERDGMPTQTLQESFSDAENLAYQLASHPWQGQTCGTDCSAPNISGQEDPTSETGSSNFSSAYSQGILNTLTRALQSSGVDLAQTSISVQINVGRQVNSGATPMTSSSKAQEDQNVNSEAMEGTGVWHSVEDTGQTQAHKRLRTEKI